MQKESNAPSIPQIVPHPYYPDQQCCKITADTQDLTTLPDNLETLWLQNSNLLQAQLVSFQLTQLANYRKIIIDGVSTDVCAKFALRDNGRIQILTLSNLSVDSITALCAHFPALVTWLGLFNLSANSITALCAHLTAQVTRLILYNLSADSITALCANVPAHVTWLTLYNLSADSITSLCAHFPPHVTWLTLSNLSADSITALCANVPAHITGLQLFNHSPAAITALCAHFPAQLTWLTLSNLNPEAIKIMENFSTNNPRVTIYGLPKKQQPQRSTPANNKAKRTRTGSSAKKVQKLSSDKKKLKQENKQLKNELKKRKPNERTVTELRSNNKILKSENEEQKVRISLLERQLQATLQQVSPEAAVEEPVNTNRPRSPSSNPYHFMPAQYDLNALINAANEGAQEARESEIKKAKIDAEEEKSYEYG